MTAHRLSDRSAALALGQALQGLGLLVVAQLELAAEPDAALDGGDAALAGAPMDAGARFLSQTGQQRQDASTRGRCQI